MSEAIVVLGLLVLVGLVTLGLGFVVLIVRGGRVRLHMRRGETSLQNEIQSHCHEEDDEKSSATGDPTDSGGSPVSAEI